MILLLLCRLQPPVRCFVDSLVSPNPFGAVVERESGLSGVHRSLPSTFRNLP